MKTAIDFRKVTNARPARLPHPDEDEDCTSFGEVMDTSGWGQAGIGQPRPNELWTVKQQCLAPTDCTRSGFNESIMICVGDKDTPENSACVGDSGGIYTIFEVLDIASNLIIIFIFDLSRLCVYFCILKGP